MFQGVSGCKVKKLSDSPEACARRKEQLDFSSPFFNAVHGPEFKQNVARCFHCALKLSKRLYFYCSISHSVSRFKIMSE